MRLFSLQNDYMLLEDRKLVVFFGMFHDSMAHGMNKNYFLINVLNRHPMSLLKTKLVSGSVVLPLWSHCTNICFRS